MRRRKADKVIALPIPGECVYTKDLAIGDSVLTPMGIAIVNRRIPLTFTTPGRYRLILELQNETIKLITTWCSIWHVQNS